MKQLIIIGLFLLCSGTLFSQTESTCTWKFPQSVAVSKNPEIPDYTVSILCSCAVKKTNVKVYSRWGIEVYESEYLTHVWSGKPTEAGVYTIIVTGEYSNGEAFTQKGSVNYYH
ncbi:MAG: gliding motility-associated C-terminal domain-containing protein [Fluviicola sp.]|nr:gliding motility-associated C-terminal domain-containing protein [Fluviicola sp.]